MTKRCTLKDIAQAANLTVNSISKVFRDDKSISQSTKERVRKIAEEMGYVPNYSASSLRTGKTNVVGVLYGNILNPYFSVMCSLVNDSLRRMGYTSMFFVEPSVSCMMEVDIARKMLAHNVDAVLTFMQPTDEVCEMLKKHKKPLVLIGRNCENPYVDCVYSDDYKGGYIMGEYLANRGLNDIVMFGVNLQCSELRFNGLKDALNSKGVDFDRKDVIRCTNENCGVVVEKLVSSGRIPQAIFCFNDIMALEAQAYIRNSNDQRVRKIQITGYDNIHSHFSVFDKIVTIDTNKKQMADVAIEILKNKLNDSAKRQQIMLDVQLETGGIE
ncbi:MAG TPA: LacI family DNA-binding transcriptional regulator [Candidatus Limihabitans stercoravium]|nr:LacI family DNA-binding transcriptional regulator [Candidatus Limihabitans stercoravium]